ncbi:MAG: N-acetylmuramoyl-L-alanine amidase [Ruminococcaceae bacterium]|nr:N-acetylmuramoyl-L-alanine amidase [Oscillospiraceae bacterium]
MKPINYDPRAVYNARRRKRRKKIVIRRIFISAVTLLLTSVLILSAVGIYRIFNPDSHDEGFIPSVFGKNISKRVEKAKELEIPSWIDIQHIHKHTTARTGIDLTDIKNIVIHYVGNPNTTAQNNRDYFDKWDTTVSSHFVVGLEGEIIQCVPLYERSAASNHRNKDTISIEVCHPDETGEFNEDTYNSVIKLTAFLCENFSLDTSAVIRHYDITEKICPKYYVENEDEWEALKQDVKEKLESYEK